MSIEQGSFYMKEGRDYSLVYKINKHFSELKDEFKSINTLEDFCNSGVIRKSILMDLLQIGELLNHVSPDFRALLDIDSVRYAIDIRNVIAHEYAKIDDEQIYETILYNLDPFIENLNNVAKKRYEKSLEDLIGKEIKVYIAGRYNKEFFKGYSPSLTMLNGEFQIVYVSMSEEKKVVYAFIDEFKLIKNDLSLIGHEK